MPRSRAAPSIQGVRDRDIRSPCPRSAFASVSPRFGLAGLPSRTNGLPDQLKANVEAMSGLSMDDVRVHRNSPEPARLGALAYTRGSDVHLGAGQEQHLPHEVWHVVQQKQGRVKPTLQLKGVGVNDQQDLEREADMMGARASAGRIAGGPARFAGSAIGPDSPVQRKIGFEFETGWFVTKDGRALRKFDRVGTTAHAGFSVTADDAGGGESDIEFIVDPVEEGAAGLAQLDAAMGGVMQVGRELERKAGLPARPQADPQSLLLGDKEPVWDPSSVPAAASSPASAQGRRAPAQRSPLDGPGFVLGEGGDAAFRIFPFGKLAARAQATTGLDLAQIGNPESALYTSPRDNLPEWDSPLRNMSDVAKEVEGEMPAEARGLITLIRLYIEAGAPPNREVDDNGEEHKQQPPSKERDYVNALPYPKQIASRAILARTDFAKLYSLLPDDFRQSMNGDRWFDLVMTGLPAGYRNQRLIEVGIQKGDYGKGDYTIGRPTLTIRDWVRRMVGSFFRPSRDLLRDMPEREGLSGFGGKTEQVGRMDRREAGIFELRGTQRTQLDLDDWPRYARESQIYVSSVHAVGRVRRSSPPKADARSRYLMSGFAR